MLIPTSPPALVCKSPQTDPPSRGSLTVEQAVALAVRQNPRIAATALDIDAARSGARSAGALINPTVLFSPGVTGVSGTGEEFLVQQPLELNGARRARAGVAAATVRATEAQASVTLREIVFLTKSAYFTLARAQRRAALAREGLALAEEFDRIARRQVELGSRPGIDLAQTGIEVSRAARQVTLADAEVTAAVAALNTVLGRRPADAVGALALPTDAPLARPGADQLAAQALAARPEIAAEEATRDRLLQEARLARAEGVPDIAPQVRVGYALRGLQPASSGNGAGVGVGISLPFIDHGGRRNRVRQSEEEARAQEARIAVARSTVQQEVAEALARLRAAESIQRSYQDGVLDQSRRLVDGSQLGFREGRTTVAALLEAQRSYLAVQTEYADALADVALARAALERAIGASPATEGATR